MLNNRGLNFKISEQSGWSNGPTPVKAWKVRFSR